MLKNIFFILSVFILDLVAASQAAGLGTLLNLQCYSPSRGVFDNVPEVKKFTRTFHSAVGKSDTLQDLFDFSKTEPKEYADFVREHTAEVLRKIKVDTQTASTIGDFAAKAITKIPSLTLDIVTRVLAHMAANFLFIDGKLNENNAENLANELAKDMEKVAKAKMNADPKSKFAAVNNGFDSLFRNDGEFTPTKAPILGFYVGNEWFIEANNQC